MIYANQIECSKSFFGNLKCEHNFLRLKVLRSLVFPFLAPQSFLRILFFFPDYSLIYIY